MSKTVSYQGFDLVRRYDNSVAVYDYCWYPDEYLDSNPEANADYLRRTEGWRAKGWIIVHVARNFREAHNWVYNVTKH